ncbi:MAG TPA: ATP-binding protein [Azospirillaceae bacterium]|nr:ATP-binding protein [Azospirillaceae bacterium]
MIASASDVFTELAHNLTLLLALAFLYAFVSRTLERHGLSRNIAVGILFGAISVASMIQPIMLAPGVILDARTIMLSLAATFGGGIAVTIAAAMVGTWRILVGLQAMEQGMLYAAEGIRAGLFSILASSAIGYVAFRIQHRRGRLFNTREFLALGVAGALPPILAAFFIPAITWSLLERATVPLLLTIPAGTCFLGVLLRAQNELFRDQEALRRSEAQYRLLAENATDIISRHAPDGRWLYASPAIETVLGYSPQEVMGRHPRDFLHPDDASFWSPTPSSADGLPVGEVRRGAFPAVVCRWRHRDGYLVWCETVARGAGASGEVTALTRDITERKAYEMDLERSRAQLVEQADELRRINADLRASTGVAETASRAKSRFLAAASHDLRQPFQAIRLFHSLLETELPPQRRAEAHARLGEALTAGEELLRALLDVSILDAGQVKPKVGAVPLRAVVEAEVGHIRPMADAKGLRVLLGPSDALVRTDPVLLKRILRNLLDNAIRYTERGGILVGCRRRGGTCRVEVWDTGAGIEADQLPRIFEEFYQIGNPERDRRQGLGLGLSVVQRMARLLEHEVTVRSVPGRGSVFTLVIPLAEPASPPVQSLATWPGPGKSGEANSLRILVVEDDPLQLFGLKLTLESWGHAAQIATSAEAALEMLDHAALPHLIVSDFRLPGAMTGLQMVAAIRQRFSRDIPAVIVTGDTDPARLVEFAAAGCRMLHKPYSSASLRRLITDARDTSIQADALA